MPTWREKAQQRLSDACKPMLKMHFDGQSNKVNVLEPGFVDNLKILCEKRGCRTIVTEINPKNDFSRVLFHDRPQDLEPVPVKRGKKGKKGKGKGKAKVTAPGPSDKLYKCWVLE
mmetsp:Transcript_24691/g.56141  ORF Transcript_24691/g.56141 Transcript_24691/m.56141 type:complete len:115 (-) Transcript_24691:116-460(-)